MNKLTIALCSTALFAGAGLTVYGAAAPQEDLDRAARELNIMSHIFQTSMQDDEQKPQFAFRQQPESRYLAGQGMVFTFNMAGMRNFLNAGAFQSQDWAEFGLAMSRYAEDIVTQVTSSFPDLDMEHDFDFDFDYDFDSDDQPTGQRQAISQMNEALREQQRAVQSVQRSLREVQRDLRNNENSRAEQEVKMQELQSTLEAEVAALEEQQKAYAGFMQEYQDQERAQQETVNRQITGRIIQSLCEYGATLKSVKDDEHITLVFENFTNDKDQIHVFPFEAVSDCTSGDQLLQSAVSYLM